MLLGVLSSQFHLPRDAFHLPNVIGCVIIVPSRQIHMKIGDQLPDLVPIGGESDRIRRYDHFLYGPAVTSAKFQMCNGSSTETYLCEQRGSIEDELKKYS
jgi:hypothetical protein